VTPPRELRTDRLWLRRWRPTDLAPFAALNTDVRVMEHFPAVLSRKASDALAARIQDHFAEHGYGLWAVEIPGVSRFAGFVGLSIARFEAHFTPFVEIGWRLAAEHWGAGYATEGARAALDFGFAELGLDEIVSFTVPANVRSRRVMEKIGMLRDPADDFERAALPAGFRRHVLYRMANPMRLRGRTRAGELRSDRLELRPLEAGDAEFVRSVYASAQVTGTLLRIQRPLSVDEARDFCRAAAAGDHRFGASRRGDGQLVALGTVRAHGEAPGVTSIGYSVLPAFWGQGLGTELAGLLVKFAVAGLGARQVRATTLDDNPASARVLEKLGFTVREAGASEVDSRGDARRVTRWVLRGP
jgi:ribosomal-protein-alanine N-acetyltransferase